MYGLYLTYLITAFGAIGSLWSPLIGLYVYAGFAVLRPQFIWAFAGDLSGLSQIVGYAMLVGWLFRGFGSWHFGRGKAVVVALGLFILWFSLSAFFALDQVRAFDSLQENAKLFLPFLVGITMMRTEADWKPLLWTIVLAQGYVGLEMNQDYLLKAYNRAQEGFGGMDNNCFGVSLICVIGPAIVLAVTSKKWWQKGLAAVSAGLILHTVLLTFSRGALVGLLAVAATAFVLLPKRPSYMGALAVTLALTAIYTGPQLRARYATILAPAEERDGSAESRLDLWADCIKVVGTYPMLGVGPANWRTISSQFGWTEGKSAHSLWMETAAETGIPGVMFLMAFFGLAAARLWRIARSQLTDANRYRIALASGVILSIVGFAVGGQFVSIPALEVPYYITMLGTVMLNSAFRTSETENAHPAVVRQPFSFAPAVSSVAALHRRSDLAEHPTR